MYKITGDKVLSYEIRVRLPDGSRYRERRESPARTRSATERWVQERQAHLLAHGKEVEARMPCPTFSEFLPRWWDARTKLKPSVKALYTNNLKADLTPFFGDMRLDAIGIEAVNKYAAQKSHKAAKTLNNEIRQLKSVLRLACDYEVLARVPNIKGVAVVHREPDFYTTEEFEVLLAAADNPIACAIILLGGEAGLRSGEMLALTMHPECIDHKRGILVIRKSIWRGHETSTKTGVERKAPATPRLLAALKALKGQPLGTYKTLQYQLRRVQKLAGFAAHGKVHSVRHTFCTRLFSAGVAERHVQELAGHATPGMTKHYTHVSEAQGRAALLAAFSRVNSGSTTSDGSVSH